MNKIIKLCLRRDQALPTRTFGTLWNGPELLGQTLEDTDRFLEAGGVKVPRETAIPRGFYRVVLDLSSRFKRIMPHILDVDQFSGVRIHGGNTEANTEGCVILAAHRHADDSGVYECADVLDALQELLEQAEQDGDEIWLEVV